MRFLRSRSVEFGLSDTSNLVKTWRRSVATSYRAVVLPRFGGPEVLELRPNVDVPDLKPNEVLVRARAVSINPLDTRMRSGYGCSIFESLLSIILGYDISGDVAAVGASVRALNVGQEVSGALRPTALRVVGTGRDASKSPVMESEANSGRDGAWKYWFALLVLDPRKTSRLM